MVGNQFAVLGVDWSEDGSDLLVKRLEFRSVGIGPPFPVDGRIEFGQLVSDQVSGLGNSQRIQPEVRVATRVRMSMIILIVMMLALFLIPLMLMIVLTLILIMVVTLFIIVMMLTLFIIVMMLALFLIPLMLMIVLTLILIMIVTLFIIVMMLTLFIIVMMLTLFLIPLMLMIVLTLILIMIVTLFIIVMMLTLILIPLMVMIVLTLVHIPLMLMIVLTLVLIMMPATKGQRVEQISYFQQVDPVCLGCLQHVNESFFQLDSVGHDEVGVVQKGYLGSRRPVVMRIRADGKEHHQLSISAHYVRNNVAQDRGGHHYLEARGRGGLARVILTDRCRVRTHRGSRRCSFLTIRTAGRKKQQASKSPRQASVTEGDHGALPFLKMGMSIINSRGTSATKSMPERPPVVTLDVTPTCEYRSPGRPPPLAVARPARTRRRRWPPWLSPGYPGPLLST